MNGDEKKKKKGSRIFKKTYTSTTNVTKTALNSVTGALFGRKWFRYRNEEGQVQHVIKRLKHRHNYINLLKNRLKELKEIEYKTIEQNKIRKEIEECYMHIGPYNRESLTKEIDLFTHGHIEGRHGLESAGRQFVPGDYLMYEEERININIRGIPPLEFPFPIPTRFPLVYPNGLVENVCAFGRDNVDKWAKAYDKVIDDMCEEIKEKMMDKLRGDGITGTRLEDMETNLNVNINTIIGGAAKIVLDDVIRLDIKTRNDTFRTFLKGKNSVDTYLRKVETLKTKMMGFIPQKVKHKHTYKIIRNLTEAERTTLMTYIPPRTNIGETTVGLDENMKPLEVAGPGGYRYKGHHYPEGTVLIDIWDANDETYFVENRINAGQIRRVPVQYITDVDTLKMACYIHNDWDEYRDDLRDARYHPHSMLAIDYTMAMNSDKGTEWKKGWKPKREIFEPQFREEWRKYKMELEGAAAVEGKRRASDLSPAFDKRALDIPGQEWEFIGKRYYYDSARMTGKYYKWDQKDPMMTTRGLSHYVIQKVIRETKFFDQAHKALLEISKETGGFDYGPRRFGEPFNKDPFNIDLTKVNEQLPDPHSDYEKGVNREGE